MSQTNGFTKNADLYRTSEAHSEVPDLELILDDLPPLAGLSCLDVATGTGHTAFFLARKAAHVFAVDINDEMLRVAQEESDRLTLSVRFLKSPADDLFFDDNTFDLVACRLAAHHFENIEGFLSEVVRVLRADGYFLLIDNVVPEDETSASLLNALEVERDPTHVRCLTEADWLERMTAAGFRVSVQEKFNKKLDYKAWMERMSHGESEQDALWKRLEAGDESVREFWNPRIEPDGSRVITLRRRIFLAQRSS